MATLSADHRAFGAFSNWHSSSSPSRLIPSSCWKLGAAAVARATRGLEECGGDLKVFVGVAVLL